MERQGGVDYAMHDRGGYAVRREGHRPGVCNGELEMLYYRENRGLDLDQ